ncbi:hypothetical protein PGTUg99_013894 [Puccinia graminis f. sp. tritici]|uniref:Uncharacterized protein n=1 Tax=Puccinia graminis f. sp. tritici TaxID=56615 RepID=A0A5B0RH77_PUCGR|nr:hypothetical protein PGTUg99_013894 [Puccinia graminis f. sp. tritici]
MRDLIGDEFADFLVSASAPNVELSDAELGLSMAGLIANDRLAAELGGSEKQLASRGVGQSGRQQLDDVALQSTIACSFGRG